MKVSRKALCVVPILLQAMYCAAQSPQQLVGEALARRDIIKSAKAQVASAKRSSASLAAFPPTRLETGVPTRPDIGGGEDLALFQPLDLFGKSRAFRGRGLASIRIAEANFRQTSLTVQGEVLTTYATWSNAQRNLGYAKDQLDAALALEKATRVRVEARSLPELQLVRAGLEVERARQLVVDREATVKSSEVLLKQALDGELPSLSPEKAGQISAALVVNDPIESNRPELLLLDSERTGFKADARSARDILLPDFEIQARRSPWSTSEQFGLRLQLTIPLWDHGASRNQARAADLQATAAELEYSDTRKKVAAEVEAATIKLTAAEQSLIAYQRLADGARDLMNKTQRGFELGASTLLDVLDAKRTRADSLEQLSNAQLAMELAVVESLRARGELIAGGGK